MAALNVELVRAQYRIQRARAVPARSSPSAGVTAQRTPADLSTSGTARHVHAYGRWGAGSPPSSSTSSARLRNLSEAALEQFLSTEEARRSAGLSLVAAVADQYLTNLALDEQIALASRTLETVEASLALTRHLYEAGRNSELELRVAETQVETARFDLVTAQAGRVRAENALVLLIGSPLPQDLPPPWPLDSQPIVADLPAGLPAEVLARRPDVLAAEHALQSANASIGAARAAFFPSITLTATGGLASADLSHLFGADQATFTFAPRLNVPIFTAGALRASLDVAEVRKSIQVAQYERTVQTAFREVADGLTSRAYLEEAVRAEDARVKAEERRYYLADLRYRKGVDSYLGLLTAQRDLFAAQQTLDPVPARAPHEPGRSLPGTGRRVEGADGRRAADESGRIVAALRSAIPVSGGASRSASDLLLIPFAM